MLVSSLRVQLVLASAGCIDLKSWSFSREPRKQQRHRVTRYGHEKGSDKLLL